MSLSHFFIDRAIFATVLSIVITIVGLITYFALPVAQYPEIAPPTIQVTAAYPGASAQVVADTVAAPIEQEINGVENMLYMSSQATGDGNLTITITFALGTDLDTAQVLVQNRVAIAEPRLPEDVRRIGVTTVKNSPDLLMVVHLVSPGGIFDQLYISNYATTQIKDVLARLDGIGAVRLLGGRDYSMRIWLDPQRMGQLDLTAGDVLTALRSQNVQVASGVLNQEPISNPAGFELSVETLGRLLDVRQFENIVIKSDADGRVTRIRDVARVELGARDYLANGYLDGQAALPMLLFQRPGSNALATAERILATMEEISQDFPKGLEYRVIYNPTEFIAESVNEVYKTIYEAVILVAIVVILFLQTWRAAIIPIVAIPVSLIGTFAVMGALGFSLNNLTLFGLVLAIGIVVDDAIVVVESVERNLRAGLSPKQAAHRTMDEVSGALIAIALVLAAVFIPTAFIPGISGQFYRQFALTIAASTAISCLVSLTLSPALAALLIKPHDQHGRPSVLTWPIRKFFDGFNFVFDRLSDGYGGLTRRLVRMSVLVLVLYGGLIRLAVHQFRSTPSGFIPEQDQGYFITVVQMPPGSSLSRTDAVIRRLSAELLEVEGVAHTTGFAGFDGATFTNAPNAGVIFVPTEPFEERIAKGLTTHGILTALREKVAKVQEGVVFVITPPPVRGIGTSGGFKMMVEDRRGRGPEALEAAVGELVARANQEPGLISVFSLFNTRTPKVFADVDRVKAEMLGVPVQNVFDALQAYIGSVYVNDFNLLGRTWRVTAQADGSHRENVEDVGRLWTRDNEGKMVPLGSIVTFRDITGAYRVPRYNLYPAAEVQGATLPGFSTGQAIAAMERLAAEMLPDGFDYDWTELAFQEKQASGPVLLIFAASVLFVFLVLAALYESWLLPLAVVLIVPMCLLAAITGVQLRGLDNNILVQIGLVVLVGLAAKNAILIVEFAKQAEEEGRSRLEAVVEAARARLRPILMTSFAFILGVVPLALATGAGSEMRISLGTAVFWGMLGVTLFGLLFTPVFYVICRWLGDRLSRVFGPVPASSPQ
jgi:HAE1 family hydrophobic/amphiphilic exporter-1